MSASILSLGVIAVVVLTTLALRNMTAIRRLIGDLRRSSRSAAFSGGAGNIPSSRPPQMRSA